MDHLNTPRLIANDTQTTVWKWEQAEPFGESSPNQDPQSTGTTFDFPLRLPGQYFDRETSLHYNYFRDYDPSLGRYVESDPIGLRGGLNIYRYANNNSISFTDPSGLWAEVLVPKVLRDLVKKALDDFTGQGTGPSTGSDIGKAICKSGGGGTRFPDRDCRARCLDKVDMTQQGASGWIEECVKACTQEIKDCKPSPTASCE